MIARSPATRAGDGVGWAPGGESIVLAWVAASSGSAGVRAAARSG
jgi:hypothetical protein